MYRKDELLLDRRFCTVYCPEGKTLLPCYYICTGQTLPDQWETMLEDIRQDVLICHVAADWERDYTPWLAPGLPGRAAFTGEARSYLHFLEERMRPYLEAHYAVSLNVRDTAIAGYSLGGLFALWALYESSMFGKAASLSGSLWYDGWMRFLESRTPPKDACVYLSLGRSEERAGNPRMAAVGENTRWTYAHLVKMLGETHVTLEWNRGGHFTGIPNRWRKALEWMASDCDEKAPD